MRYFKHCLIICALLFLLAPLSGSLCACKFGALCSPAFAQAVTPRILVNGSSVGVDVPKMTKIKVSYDVRCSQGTKALLKVFCLPDTSESAAEIVTDSVSGIAELTAFRKFPAGHYSIICISLDSNGEPNAYPSPPVIVKYGGPKADRAYEYRRRVMQGATDDPKAFHKMPVAVDEPDDPAVQNKQAPRQKFSVLSISPKSAIVAPKGFLVLKAGLEFKESKTPQFTWELKGPGKLVDAGKGRAVYYAPNDAEGTCVVRCTTQDGFYQEALAEITITDLPYEADSTIEVVGDEPSHEEENIFIETEDEDSNTDTLRIINK
ncbi:MAG: hypothetical protein K6G50_00650 [bacterium]|nr:hypothetical protein [bacterium]